MTTEVVKDTLKAAVLIEDWVYTEEVCDMFRYLYPGCHVDLSWTAEGELIATARVFSPAETKNAD